MNLIVLSASAFLIFSEFFHVKASISTVNSLKQIPWYRIKICHNQLLLFHFVFSLSNFFSVKVLLMKNLSLKSECKDLMFSLLHLIPCRTQNMWLCQLFWQYLIIFEFSSNSKNTSSLCMCKRTQWSCSMALCKQGKSWNMWWRWANSAYKGILIILLFLGKSYQITFLSDWGYQFEND